MKNARSFKSKFFRLISTSETSKVDNLLVLSLVSLQALGLQDSDDEAEAEEIAVKEVSRNFFIVSTSNTARLLLTYCCFCFVLFCVTSD